MLILNVIFKSSYITGKRDDKPYSYNHDGYKQNSYKQSQQGVALLTVLLLVVAITVVAGAMLAGQKMSIRQYSLLLTQDQILQDVHASEQLAVALIAADAKANDTDSLLDVWAKPIPQIPYANHHIALTIQDASGRFNINNLYHDGAKDEAAIAVFQRLLTNVGLEPNLAYAVLDWQDADSETSSEGGAEADAYQSDAMSSINMTSGQPVLTSSSIGNQPFVSVDELMSVRGFTPEKVSQLRPFITAVPYYLPININTANVRTLSALIENGKPEQFSAFNQQVQKEPATSVDSVLQQPPWSALSKEELEQVKPLMAVRSQAFYVLIDVMVDDDNTGKKKHRYATTFVSKNVAEDNVDDGRVNDGTINAGQVNEGQVAAQNSTMQNNTKPNSIQAFGTRFWTYRPTF